MKKESPRPPEPAPAGAAANYDWSELLDNGFSRSIIADGELPLVIGLPNFGAGKHLPRVETAPVPSTRHLG